MSSLRVLHTSDWHIGKKLFGIERYREHAHFFQWLIETINNEKIDVVIVAGDIYDVPSPPHKAVKLFFEFIKNFLDNTEAKLVIIGGNHDGPVFLESPNPVLDADRIYIKASMDEDIQKHTLSFEAGGEIINLFLLPYFRNYEIEKWFEKQGENDEKSKDEEQAILDQLDLVFGKTHQEKGFNILVAHHLFGQFEPSDSEYNIQLSGVNSIPTFLLKKYFDYVALGHIHKYQKISSTPPSYYTGSPIAFRFSETSQKKVNIIEFKNNEVDVQAREITPLITLHTLKCHISELDNELKQLKDQYKKSEELVFLEAQIRVDGPIINLAQTINDKLEETKIELLSLLPVFKSNITGENKEHESVHQKSLTDHFIDYYRHVYGEEEVDEVVLEEFKSLLGEVKTIEGGDSA